jgi:hypothetical protein
MDTFHISRREVREAEPPARIRNDDLPPVEVPGEDEVKDSRNPADDAREVAEQDAQIGAGVDEVLRTRASVGVHLWIYTHDLDAPSSELQLDALIAQERDTLDSSDCGWIDALRERVAAVGEVVVPEHDVALPEPGQEALELRDSRPARHEIAGDAHEVGLALDDPLDGIGDSLSASTGHAEVQIRQMRDA